MHSLSDHFNGRIFLNPVPTDVMVRGAFWKLMRKYFQSHPNKFPLTPLGPFQADLNALNHTPSDALRVTWLGHSGAILDIDGKRFLMDPVWYDRASPFTLIGPKRFFDNPIALKDLPPFDYLLLSHDHYDHLDKQSILELSTRNIPIITMLGVGKRLVGWGIPQDLVTELDWWQVVDLGDGFVVTATPARHFSGRWVNDRFSTLWGAFAIKGPHHNVFFGGDSGYYEGFITIGEKLGPFDLTMLEIGAYNDEWPQIHMGPESAVQAHIDLSGNLLMPLHWGTFSLAFHSWTDPIERLLFEAAKRAVPLLLPRPGETCTVERAYNSAWWVQNDQEING